MHNLQNPSLKTSDCYAYPRKVSVLRRVDCALHLDLVFRFWDLIMLHV